MRAQKPKGSVVFNRTRGTWNYLWCEGGKRRSRMLGTALELPTRAEALQKAETVRRDVRLLTERTVPTVRSIVQQYRTERLPKLRHTTQRIAGLWLNKYALGHWGDHRITDLQPRPVELWLDSLPLAPKTRGHIRELLHQLVDFAMWSGAIPVGVNPITLVTVRGSSKRTKEPRSLKVEEFQTLLEHLSEPFKTMALVQVCLGLRVSELLALRWKNVDWMAKRLNVESGIVNQHIDTVKTEESRKSMNLDSRLLAVLSACRQRSEFREAEDWIFPSPLKLGRLPYSYTGYWRALQDAAQAAELGRIGTHSFRHTYRSWLDAVGTALTVQQKLMRHSDIQTTLNIYGTVVTSEMQEASAKVASLALKN
jgi:integrase